MNVTRTAAVALIAFSGVALPTAGAAHADGDPPLLCGLLSPCGDGSSDDDTSDDAQPAPVDIDVDLDLDVDLGTDVTGNVGATANVDALPSDSTLLVADADVTSAAFQANALDHTIDTGGDAVLDTDAAVGHGVVVTANGAADAQADVNAASRKLVSADAANQFCGVQIVIAASSSQRCQSSRSNVIGSGDGLVAVVESVDLCGAHVVVDGSATTDCGDSSPGGSPAAGSSWTLADATAIGNVCGVSVAVVAESDTSCAGTAQEAPVPESGSNEPGTGTSGTGAAAANAGGSAAAPSVGGESASSPTAQPAQVGGDSGASTGDSGGSLPLTGTSILLILTIAGITLAAGLVAVRSSRVGVGHQS
jgi:hypothetical protein